MDGGEVVDTRESLQCCSLCPAITGMIQEDRRNLATEVEDVRDARAVDVGKTNAALIELIRPVEPRGRIHCDLRAEPTVADIRPIADFAISDAYKVREAIA